MVKPLSNHVVRASPMASGLAERIHGQLVEKAGMMISREFKIKSKIWLSKLLGESV
jgi:hypothetical protein